MDELTKQRIDDAYKIMCKINSDGLQEHSGLIEEALHWFLLDCLEEIEFERLKMQMFAPRKSRIFLEH